MKKQILLLLTCLGLSLMAQYTNKPYDYVPPLDRDDSLAGAVSNLVVSGIIIKTDIILSKDLKNEYYKSILKISNTYKNTIAYSKDTLSIITWKGQYVPKKKIKPGEEELPTTVFDVPQPPEEGISGIFLLNYSKYKPHFRFWGKAEFSRKINENHFNGKIFSKSYILYQYLDQLSGVEIPDSLTNEAVSEAREEKEEKAQKAERLLKVRATNKQVADSLRNNPKRNAEFAQKYPLPQNWSSMNELEKTTYREKFYYTMDSTYKAKLKQCKKSPN